MKIIKKAGVVILTLLLIIVCIWHKVIFYGFSQLKGQWHIVYAARPVEEILNDPAAPPGWKEKLILIDKIKSFAVDSLGLLPSESYSTIYDQQNKPALWVLTASLPYSLEAKTWWFPIVGTVSYKGYFNKKKGEKERESLIKTGYDTDLSPVAGWSTLGWFRDPILSNMLKKNEGVLAEIIIHEILHGTIYLESGVDFNENLATFIGEEGAVSFLKSYFGDSSVQMINYIHYKNDEFLYGNYMLNAQHNLDSLYKSWNSGMHESQKKAEKSRFISGIMQGIDSLPLFNKEKYQFNFNEDSLPNNTFFMSNNRYRKDQKKLQEFVSERFKGDLKSFIGYLKKTEEDVVFSDLTD